MYLERHGLACPEQDSLDYITSCCMSTKSSRWLMCLWRTCQSSVRQVKQSDVLHDIPGPRKYHGCLTIGDRHHLNLMRPPGAPWTLIRRQFTQSTSNLTLAPRKFLCYGQSWLQMYSVNVRVPRTPFHHVPNPVLDMPASTFRVERSRPSGLKKLERSAMYWLTPTCPVSRDSSLCTIEFRITAQLTSTTLT